MLDEKVIQLKEAFVNYTSLIREILQKVQGGLTDKCDLTLREVIDKDEVIVNSKEIEIDELCVNLIAQFQPKAKVLRTIMMIYKINSDLERIGDEAVGVAQSGIYLLLHDKFLNMVDFVDILNQVIVMYQDSIQAFMLEDSSLARSVLSKDAIIDCFNQNVYHQFKTEMIENPKVVSPSLHIMKISRNIERIADHVTNVAEDVVYMVEGCVLKHQDS